jgi:hypothetical protein
MRGGRAIGSTPGSAVRQRMTVFRRQCDAKSLVALPASVRLYLTSIACGLGLGRQVRHGDAEPFCQAP